MHASLQPLIAEWPAWLASEGPEPDICVATRIRFARNRDEVPFPHVMESARAEEFVAEALTRLSDLLSESIVLRPQELSSEERDFVVERSLASRDLVEATRPTGLLFDREGCCSIMLNEEDHFRAQAILPGLSGTAALERVQPIVKAIEGLFPAAVHERYGYLTACPTNTGSGLRCSVMMHLPALGRHPRRLQQVLQTAQRTGLAVRGVHGEGSQALGHLYQISNQRTLGRTVSDLVDEVGQFGERILTVERELRDDLLADGEARAELDRQVQDAHELLGESEGMATPPALEALSTLRLATLAELAPGLRPHALLQQAFALQPGHIQARVGMALDPSQRDLYRARLLRTALGIPEPGEEP